MRSTDEVLPQFPARDEGQGPVDGHVQYRRDGHALIEVPPKLCPNGHPLGPGLGTVGWDGSCRTYSCNRCWAAHVKDRSVRHELRYAVGYTEGDEIEWTNRPAG